MCKRKKGTKITTLLSNNYFSLPLDLKLANTAKEATKMLPLGIIF